MIWHSPALASNGAKESYLGADNALVTVTWQLRSFGACHKKKSLVGALTEEEKDAGMVGLFWSDN